ncbi:MAG TPA: galactose oxidase, partial [Actinoplanes sp.]|nr:galactose oxidase [Actinoplanes sp.]
MNTPLPLFSRRDRVRIAQILVFALLLVLAVPYRAAASANLLTNGGLETLDGTGFPVCWEQSGWGDSSYTFGVSHTAHTGANAMKITVTDISNGDRKAMMLEDPSCAPNVTPGHQYDLSAWYTTTSPNTVMTMFRHTAQG